MIFGAFLNASYYVINFIVSLFPASDGIPQTAHNAVASLGGYLGIFDPLVNFSVMATVVGIIISVELAIFGWKTAKSILSHIPWVGGKG
jgi:hypothetical protein